MAKWDKPSNCWFNQQYVSIRSPPCLQGSCALSFSSFDPSIHPYIHPSMHTYIQPPPATPSHARVLYPCHSPLPPPSPSLSLGRLTCAAVSRKCMDWM